MKRDLLDLSEKIDPLSIQLYDAVSEAAKVVGIRFIVVGATARDVVLELGYGIETGRATKDVDIGVYVNDWEQFEMLKKELLNQSGFTETTTYYRVNFEEEIPVDILPFGPIATEKKEISFPPEHDSVMSMVGFDEALSSAQPIRLRVDPPLEVLFTSPVALAVLKLISWADQPQARTKDIVDFSVILRNYLDAGNNERLYKEHPDIVEDENFDYEEGGARLLGRDIQAEFSGTTANRVLEIVKTELTMAQESSLIRNIAKNILLVEESREAQFRSAGTLLNAMVKGIEEMSNKVG